MLGSPDPESRETAPLIRPRRPPHFGSLENRTVLHAVDMQSHLDRTPRQCQRPQSAGPAGPCDARSQPQTTMATAGVQPTYDEVKRQSPPSSIYAGVGRYFESHRANRDGRSASRCSSSYTCPRCWVAPLWSGRRRRTRGVALLERHQRPLWLISELRLSACYCSSRLTC